MIKKIILLIFVLFQINLTAEEPLIFTKAMWMWGSQLGSQPTKTLVEKLKSNYVNKIYLLVKGGAGTRTSSSSLTEFITEAHSAGIEVHLWYCVLEDSKYLVSHPQAHVYHCPKPGINDNKPYPIDDGRVNLLYPGYKEYVLEGIEYFVNNFDADGIHLDYIRYPHLVFSFDEYHIKKADSLGCNTQRLLDLFINDYDKVAGGGFITMYGDKDADVIKWVTMRKNIVNDYVKSIRALMDSLKPSLKLTASFMPEGAVSKNLADTHYAQNYELNSPYLDEICIMSYFLSYGQATSWLRDVTQAALKEVSSNCKIITGFQTFDGVTAMQVREQLYYGLRGGAHGLVGFRYGTTTSAHWTEIKEKFQEMEPKTMIDSEIQKMSGSVCDTLENKNIIPEKIFIDSTKTSSVSAAEFYYMMVYYLRHFNKQGKSPLITPVIKDISNPKVPSGSQPENQIQLADIMSLAKKDADFIDSAKAVPDFIHSDTVNYVPAAMFWVYARTINWYSKNGVMPNYATVRACEGPETWVGNLSSTETGKESVIPHEFELLQNYPNPFNPSTDIHFRLSEAGFVKLKIHDVLGNDIATLVENDLPAGEHKVHFNASGLSSGIYFYLCESNNKTAIKKMLLMR